MSYKIDWDLMLDEFEYENPELAREMVDWYPSGQMEITIKLRGGAKIAYDYVLKTIRSVYDPDDNGECIPEDIYRREFATRLYRKMRTVGITQEELGNKVGISRVSLSNYITGKSIPNIYILIKLAKALKCSISELTDVG